jgi:hypothetical protein
MLESDLAQLASVSSSAVGITEAPNAEARIAVDVSDLRAQDRSVRPQAVAMFCACGKSLAFSEFRNFQAK